MAGRSSHLKHAPIIQMRLPCPGEAFQFGDQGVTAEWGFRRHRWGFRRHGLSNPQPRNPYSETRFRPKSETHPRRPAPQIQQTPQGKTSLAVLKRPVESDAPQTVAGVVSLRGNSLFNASLSTVSLLSYI